MKKALKVTFGAVMAAGFIATAQAHEEYFLNNTTLWVAGTYMKASNNGLSVGDAVITTSSTNFLGTTFDGRRPTFLEPDHNWDWTLGAAFEIPNSPSYVFITYDHFHDHDARSDGYGPGFINLYIDSPVSFPVAASANVNQKADELRFGLARTVPLGRRFTVDLSAFLEWARLKREVYETVSQSTTSLLSNRSTENKMRGFGPGVGALGRVVPFVSAPNWSFFAGMMNTLFFAKNDYQQFWNFSSPGSSGVFIIDPEQSESVTGKTDIKFGVEYMCYFNRQRGNDILFNVALGMRYINYFNAFKNGNTSYSSPVSSSFATAVYAGGAEDWGRWGPYLQFTLGGPTV